MGASVSVPERSVHEFTVKSSSEVPRASILPVLSENSQANPAFCSDSFQAASVFTVMISGFIWGGGLWTIVFCSVARPDSSGKDVNLSIYQGKVLLLVNVASKCGFTESNYTQLTELYRKYKDQGFEILAFPCNQFLYQEPGTSQDAHDFACTRFQAEYPVFQKVRVNGQNAAPLYKFLKASKPTFLGSRIKWNFTKFLVSKDGIVIDRYGTMVTPLSIEKDIKKALEKA
ncbi:hypothetical protein IGI04_017240 [Brassica rapa subsp. trilocularis]|uniref:Glutathione peroxidase n=1 Tax=Brassica rapa subsp. trilocularis TaxID=1813537 RepID=A0ABQ7MVB9_BRACM|nr:hypothetical protein IGI04_017240 [Brassica rapa subsp. trilocularis]